MNYFEIKEKEIKIWKILKLLTSVKLLLLLNIYKTKFDLQKKLKIKLASMMVE